MDYFDQRTHEWVQAQIEKARTFKKPCFARDQIRLPHDSARRKSFCSPALYDLIDLDDLEPVEMATEIKPSVSFKRQL